MGTMLFSINNNLFSVWTGPIKCNKVLQVGIRIILVESKITIKKKKKKKSKLMKNNA